MPGARMPGAKAEVYENALALPLGVRGDELASLLKGGLFADGRSITSSLLFRYYTGPQGEASQIVFAADPARPQAHISRPVIFAGYLFESFGHFVLESLSRLWIAPGYPELPILWAAARPGYAPWQEEILELLNVKNAPLFVTVPTSLAEVVVPEPGYELGADFTPEHADFLAAVDPA